jgi:hypothetical protein
MDPTKQFRERSRNPLLANGRFIGAVFGAIFTIPALLYLLVAGDAYLVYETWPWRTAVKTKAEILEHEFVRSKLAMNLEEAQDYRPSRHRFRYQFQVGPEEIGEQLEIPSMDEASVTVNERKYTIKQGGTIPIYYLPDNPSQHVLFLDPVAIYWSSVTRLSWLTLIALTGVLIVVAVVVFYRPKKTDRSYLPTKIDASEFKMDA